MMWFNYKNAFDSPKHDWIIKALQLAKVPSNIINAISKLMKAYETKITLRAENETIETRLINYFADDLKTYASDENVFFKFIIKFNLHGTFSEYLIV